MELLYNFFDKFCDVSKFESLKMDTDVLYLAVAEKICVPLFFPASELNGLKGEARTVETISEQMRITSFPAVLATLNIRNLTRENQDCSRKLSNAPIYCVSVVKLNAVTIVEVKT